MVIAPIDAVVPRNEFFQRLSSSVQRPKLSPGFLAFIVPICLHQGHILILVEKFVKDQAKDDEMLINVRCREENRQNCIFRVMLSTSRMLVCYHGEMLPELPHNFIHSSVFSAAGSLGMTLRSRHVTGCS